MLEIVLIRYCSKRHCLTYVRAWRNGRRRRLKISSLYGRVGSSPAVRTTLNFKTLEASLVLSNWLVEILYW